MDQDRTPTNHPTPRASRRRTWLIVLVIGLVGLLSTSGLLAIWLLKQPTVDPTKPAVDGNTNLSQEEVDVAQVFRKVSPRARRLFARVAGIRWRGWRPIRLCCRRRWLWLR